MCRNIGKRERDCVRVKLQALVYDILPLEEGPGKRCSECACVCERARVGDWEWGGGGVTNNSVIKLMCVKTGTYRAFKDKKIKKILTINS